MPQRTPDLLIIGHVTRDEIDGQVRLGGAASFAARAASALGLDAAVVTSAPRRWPLLDELRGHARLHVVPSARPTTFALTYQKDRRHLRLLARAETIRARDVPAELRGAPVAYVGPVAGECRRALVDSLAPAFVAVGLQGWLRRAAADGSVVPTIFPEARTPPRGLAAGILSEQDHPRADAIAAELASRGIVVAVTRAARGSTIHAGGSRHAIPSAPAREVDPTGAGDVYGVVFAVALARGASPKEAARRASFAAARAVEAPGVGALTALVAARALHGVAR